MYFMTWPISSIYSPIYLLTYLPIYTVMAFSPSPVFIKYSGVYAIDVFQTSASLGGCPQIRRHNTVHELVLKALFKAGIVHTRQLVVFKGEIEWSVFISMVLVWCIIEN